MISLTPFLKDPNSRTGSTSGDPASRQVEALNRVISVLMQGIAIHGFDYDETAFRAFQNAVWKMRSGFDQATDEDSAMLMAGAVIRLMEEHNDSAQAHLRACHVEVSGLLGRVLETLLEVTHSNPQTQANLRGIAQEITRACSVMAIHAIKPRLEVSLAEIRAKAQLPVARLHPEPTTPGETDTVTGLPDAGCAIEAIAGAWQQKSDLYVALFALEYLETINQRFGFRTGDELLSQLSQHVGQHMAAPDQLFRWRGPCLVALVQRKLPESFVAAEMGRIVPARMENATIVREREAIVRVSTSWSLMHLDSVETLDDAITRMNEFAGNRSRFVRQVSAGM